MSENDPIPPVACTLSEEEETGRSEQVRSVLASSYRGAEERDDGFALLFDGTDEALPALAAFVSAELRCCSFAEYSIDVSPPYEETRLIIAGPDGTKAVFGEGLIDRLEAGTRQG